MFGVPWEVYQTLVDRFLMTERLVGIGYRLLPDEK